uniref:Mediator of RNA polymerase II transcription subunit 21 n=1 Tax=Phaeocystis antarctica TaxID=33657 RepID=A0A7S0EAG4_9EUKA
MAEPAAVSPKDGAHQPVTALQVKATELCHTYFTALGHLQNAAPEAPLDETGPARTARVAGFQGLVDELAAAVVQKHSEIEGLVDELEAMPRSEEDELRRLREAQEDHAAATESLRASVAKTERLAGSVRGSLDSLLTSGEQRDPWIKGAGSL